MAENINSEADAVTIRRYCPLDGSRLVWMEQLTQFPQFSGWECPDCGYFELQ